MARPLASPLARPLPQPPLLLITDRTQAQADLAQADLAQVVAQACAAGCRWVSLREKDLPAPAQLELFARLRAVTHRFDVTLTLHGSPELALAAGADGVHLSAGSDARAARAVLGPSALVGLSVHGIEEAAAVPVDALDYITASPVFLTASKPGHGPALGPGGLARFVAASPVPVIALGGITQDQIAGCIETGAAGVAVMGHVMRAPSPGAQMAALLSGLGERHHS